ncbi:hypothetical protein [Deinococcus hopiensis]|uniref:DUF4397 domain-containing protein n=1 Tax=Deinococcus hopiensis KR-140 TaxID=695939 RepID=A0A1W1UBC7_9DEIO|nr:hypothetical protein [Deinococcus hopiensis]SMB78377.1 hypothetical protein SAMN00790413_06625 [Deinococcus hopiensis KR-140]
MRNFKALLLSAFIATTALTTSASASPVYFDNDSGQSGVVDVYVDGKLVFDNVFADSSMMFPTDITAGKHDVVITPNYLALGEADILNTSIDIPETDPDTGAYTVTLTTGTDDLDVPELGLSIDAGHID